MIHNAILTYLQDYLEDEMITNIPTSDLSRAGVVKIGDLQGEPEPDEARISVTLYVSDPDQFISGAPTSMDTAWNDELMMAEIGGAQTYKRRFCVKMRCMFERTQEDLEGATEYASKARSRLERALLRATLGSISTDNESVVSNVMYFTSEGIQAGGPPDSYDLLVKIRFEVWTTLTI